MGLACTRQCSVDEEIVCWLIIRPGNLFGNSCLKFSRKQNATKTCVSIFLEACCYPWPSAVQWKDLPSIAPSLWVAVLANRSQFPNWLLFKPKPNQQNPQSHARQHYFLAFPLPLSPSNIDLEQPKITNLIIPVALRRWPLLSCPVTQMFMDLLKIHSSNRCPWLWCLLSKRLGIQGHSTMTMSLVFCCGAGHFASSCKLRTEFAKSSYSGDHPQ